jgi:hypothetical protein
MLAGKAFAVSRLLDAEVPAPRTRPRAHIAASGHGAIQALSAADVVELENKAKENARSRIDFESLQSIIPLIACILWILGGTIFYAKHDKFGWVCLYLALFLSVTFAIRLWVYI